MNVPFDYYHSVCYACSFWLHTFKQIANCHFSILLWHVGLETLYIYDPIKHVSLKDTEKKKTLHKYQLFNVNQFSFIIIINKKLLFFFKHGKVAWCVQYQLLLCPHVEKFDEWHFSHMTQQQQKWWKFTKPLPIHLRPSMQLDAPSGQTHRHVTWLEGRHSWEGLQNLCWHALSGITPLLSSRPCTLTTLHFTRRRWLHTKAPDGTHTMGKDRSGLQRREKDFIIDLDVYVKGMKLKQKSKESCNNEEMLIFRTFITT